MEYSNRTFSFSEFPVNEIEPENLVILENGGKYAFDISIISDDLNYDIDNIMFDQNPVSIGSVENYQMIKDRLNKLLTRNGLEDYQRDSVERAILAIDKKILSFEQEGILYKPSQDVIKLIYRLACFSQFLQTLLATESTMESKVKNEQETEVYNRHHENIQGSLGVFLGVLGIVLDSFDEDNRQKFLQMQFIPKSHTFPTMNIWLDAYRAFNPTAQCNGTNRGKFYTTYEGYSRFFYPDTPIKDLDRANCGMTKLSDINTNLTEGLTDLTFETINNSAELARFNAFIAGFSKTGVINNSELNQELEYKNKYLKYKNKYQQLKKLMK